MKSFNDSLPIKLQKKQVDGNVYATFKNTGNVVFKYIPIFGKFPPMSTIKKKRSMQDNRAVSCRDTFSPDSLGNRKYITFMEATRMLGIIRIIT